MVGTGARSLQRFRGCWPEDGRSKISFASGWQEYKIMDIKIVGVGTYGPEDDRSRSLWDSGWQD